MDLHHLSASSAKLFLECEAQWASKYRDKASTLGGHAANLGTVIHIALENYVKGLWHKSAATDDQKRNALMGLYDQAFDLAFPQETRYINQLRDEGWGMLVDWLNRDTDWEGVNTRSVELDSWFVLETKFGPVRFVYRIDRVDERLEDARIIVTDYKSGWWQKTVEELRDDIQVRSYAVAAWKMFPGRDRYTVVFDYLRSNKGPAGVTFWVEEIEQIYGQLCRLAERIIESDGSKETVNAGCRFCHRKHECSALKAHATGGGIHGLTMEQVVDRRVELTHTMKALEQSLVELDAEIASELASEDAPLVLKGSGAEGVAYRSVNRRTVDLEELLKMMPVDEVLAAGGRVDFSVGALDELIRNTDDPEAKRKLQGLQKRKTNKPSIMVVKIKDSDE